MTPKEFSDWVTTAQPGSHVVYYTGFLCHDRTIQVDVGTGKQPKMESIPVPDVIAIGAEAQRAYQAGVVELVQSRTPHEAVFDYIAVKRRRKARR